MTTRVNVSLFVMGFGGLVAEVLLLRELVVAFSGNELCIGIILGNWLLLEALGCLFSGRVAAGARRVPEGYALLSALFSVALLAAVFAARMLRRTWGASLGEPLSLEAVFVSSFLVLLPVSLLHGAQFTFGCRLHAVLSGRRRESAARVYVIEAAGTLAAGLAGTYLLFPYLNAFGTAATVAGLNATACLFLLPPVTGRHRFAFRAASWLLLLASGWLLFGGLAGRLNDLSIQAQWRGHTVVCHRHSRHGHVAVTEAEGQYTFFLDGVPSLLIPVPDLVERDVFAHLPLLCHPHPERVLLIGGGAGGVIAAVLRHPSIRSIDYVELDPLFPELLKTFATRLTEAELSDPRVAVHRTDGRRLLNLAPDRYDVILVGVREPSSLQANRFFTREFFSLAHGRLRDWGLLVLGLPGSLSLADIELQRLHACIHGALLDAFPYVRAFPGEGRHLFVAAASANILTVSAEDLAARLRDRAGAAVLPWHVENRLHPGWQDGFARRLAGVDVPSNRDFRPVGVYYSARHWTVLSSAAVGAAFRKLDARTLRISAALLVAVALLPGLCARGRNAFAARVPFAMATTGFAGMVFGLAVIAAFQTVHGYVISWIGLLVAGYMTGSACGAWRAGRRAATPPEAARLFVRNELAILVFAILLPLFVHIAVMTARLPGGAPLVRAIFLTASFLAGGLTAHEFPLAHVLCSPSGADTSRAAGKLYALDLFGGWFGGTIGGVVLLPLLGLHETCFLLGVLKLTGFLLTGAAARTFQGTADGRMST